MFHAVSRITRDHIGEGAVTRSQTRALLVCGVASSLVYAAMNAFIPLLWPEYSVTTQTISELSAVGAPTRPVWVITGVLYTLLYAGFGLGVLQYAADNNRLRAAGVIIIAQGILGVYWPPMQQRGNEFALTDAMHIAWAIVTLVLMLVTIGFGAMSLGAAFKRYSIATVAVFLVFGVLTGIESPGIAGNFPTPLIGVWERINIAAFMLWVAVFAVALMRDNREGIAALNPQEA